MQVIATISAGVSALALVQTLPPAPSAVLPAPHAGPPSPVAPPPEQSLLIWHAGQARCGSAAPTALRIPTPLPTLTWSREPEKPVTFTFRIDASGRPLGIAASAPRYSGHDDLAPALAVTRFAAGAQESCTITFSAQRQPFANVSPELAMAYSVFPTGAAVPASLWSRVEPAGSTCFRTRPAVLNRGFPDFRALPGEQGRPLWSMVAFDIAANGKPVRVRTLTGSQWAPLDAASRTAVSRSRFARGARQGCLFPYRKNADPLPAPDAPAPESFGAISPACRAMDAWARTPRLNYPASFRRRGIEGWAVIRFDVAPWGAVGNAKVLAAEPTSEFGQAGLGTILSASKAPSALGASGCIDRVRFVMARPGTPAPEPATVAY